MTFFKTYFAESVTRKSYQEEKMSKYVNTNSNEHHLGLKGLMFDKLQKKRLKVEIEDLIIVGILESNTK